MTERTAYATHGIEPPDALDLGPRTVHEVLTRQMVETVETDLQEIKQRLNGLIFTVVGAFVVDIALRLSGG